MSQRTTPELFDMSDHVAVITGAGRGIGEGIAKSFSEAGASVVLAARRTEEIDRVATEINESGGSAIPVKSDLYEDDAEDYLGKEAMAEVGKLKKKEKDFLRSLL